MHTQRRTIGTPGSGGRASIIIVVGLLLAGALSAVSTAWSQTPVVEPPATEEPAKPPEPAPVALADLPRELDSDDKIVKTLVEPLKTASQLETWRANARALEAEVVALVTGPEYLGLEQMSLDAAQSLRDRLANMGGRLNNAQERIQSRADEVATGFGTIERLEKRWTLTSESLAGQEVPDALRERLARLRKNITEVGKTYRERLDALLMVEDRIETLSEQIDQQLNVVDARIEILRGSLLAKDQPSLWQLAGETSEPALYEPVAAQFDRQRQSLKQFWDKHRLTAVYQALLFVAIWLTMAWVARNTEPLPEDDPAFRAYEAVVHHPAAVAMVITLLFTRTFYPDAPRVVYQINLLAMIPAALFMTPRMGAGGQTMAMRALLAIIALFVIHRAGQIFLPYGLAERLLLLAVAIASGPILLRLYRDLEAVPSHHKITLTWALKIFAVLCVVSALANILGHVTVTRLLLNGVLTSVAVAVVLNVAALVLMGMFGAVLRTPFMRKLLIVRHHGDQLRARIGAIIHGLSLVLLVLLSLSLFNLRVPLWNALKEIFTHTISIGSLEFSLAGVLLFPFIVWLGFKIAATTRFVLQEDVYPRVKMARGVPQAITKLTSYGLIALAIIAAITASGLDLSRLALFAGALSLGIGFGLQNIVNNFVSGLILIFERPIEAGDTVELGTLMGQVTRIGIRSSTIRTYDGADVIVPNADLISKEVINWTLSDRYKRLIIPVGVAYGTDPRTVLNLLVDVAREDPDVLSFPEPYALFREFGDSSLNFELRCWCAFDVALGTNSRLNVGINDALAAADIEIPFPQRDLHLRSVDSAITATIPGAKRKSDNTKPEATSAAPPTDLPAVPNEGDLT
jgi:potassium efflux system protein